MCNSKLVLTWYSLSLYSSASNAHMVLVPPPKGNSRSLVPNTTSSGAHTARATAHVTAMAMEVLHTVRREMERTGYTTARYLGIYSSDRSIDLPGNVEKILRER